MGATKRDDETFVLFSACLSNNLRYYLRSREVDKNFDRFFDLLVADKLKSCMGHSRPVKLYIESGRRQLVRG